MDDTSPKQSPTQANIDDLVKELSRPQNIGRPSAPAPAPVASRPVVQPVMPKPPVSAVMPPQTASNQPKPISPAPAPVMPPAPILPKSPLSAPAPAAPTPAPAPKPAAPKEYQSNIRTMTDDLSKLRSGQQLQGVTIPRTIEDQSKAPTLAPKPAVPAPVKAPTVQVNLGQGQKAAPLAPTAPKPAVPKGSAEQKNQFYVPEEPAPAAGGMNRNLLFIGIGGAVVVLAAAYWYFMIRQPSVQVVESPTPTITESPSPSPTPVALESIFANQGGTIALPITGDPGKAFATALAAQAVNPGQLVVLTVSGSAASGSTQILGTFDLLDRFLISYPANWKSAAQRSISLAYGQQEKFDAKGHPISNPPPSDRLVLVTELTGATMDVLRTWEPSMTGALAGLFGFDKSKNAGPFQDNSYQGVPIRYKNFPNPDHSIDYAIVTYQGKTYWVLAASRESMFAVVNAFNAPR